MGEEEVVQHLAEKQVNAKQDPVSGLICCRSQAIQVTFVVQIFAASTAAAVALLNCTSNVWISNGCSESF
jgi:hypothetical protein